LGTGICYLQSRLKLNELHRAKELRLCVIVCDSSFVIAKILSCDHHLSPLSIRELPLSWYAADPEINFPSGHRLLRVHYLALLQKQVYSTIFSSAVIDFVAPSPPDSSEPQTFYHDSPRSTSPSPWKCFLTLKMLKLIGTMSLVICICPFTLTNDSIRAACRSSCCIGCPLSLLECAG
jgi:hypothetical protein